MGNHMERARIRLSTIDRPRRRGSILILTAVLLTVLMGIAALAVDFGNLSDYRHRMQSAADAAAIAGAREIKRSSTISNGDVQTFVYHDASTNGFTNGVNGVVITVNRGPATGNFAGNAKYVEVLISRAVPTYFMGLFGRPTMNVGVRAVAGQDGSPSGCIYALGAGSNAFETASTAIVNVPGCDILVNSANSKAMFTGDAYIAAHAINVVGGLGGSPAKTDFVIDGVDHSTPTTGATAVTDPYSSTPVPAPGACTPVPGGLTVVLAPGTYCGDISYNGVNVTFQAGLYVLKNGALQVSGSSVVRGTDVTFYSVYDVGIGPHSTILDSNTDIKLSAPTSGSYANILFASTITGTSTGNRFQSDNMTLNGVIYFPHMHVEWKGNTGADYTILVCDNVKFNGNSSLSSSFGGAPGSPAAGFVSKAE